MVPNSEPKNGCELPGTEVFTLAEAAAYLRVPEEAVLALVANEALPAQQIGGEWRFLKRAVADWLRFGPHYHHEFGRFPPPWIVDHPFWEDLFLALEKRIVHRIEAQELPAPKRGSKQAVMKHFGVFEKDTDLDEQLAAIHARRGTE